MIAKIINNFIETKLLEDGKLIFGTGEGFNANIPTVTGFETVVNDYQFKLTSIGRNNPTGAAQYFRDLKDSNVNTFFLEDTLTAFLD